MIEHTRHLPLEGSYNIRDLGGYHTSDGKQVRWRTLLRADALHRLTPDAQRHLFDLGLRTVIDLRFTSEIEAAPNVFASTPSIRYINIPLLNPPTSSGARTLPPSLDMIYRSAIDQGAAAVKAVFDTLTAPNAFPAVFHCTAGKDRTGIIAALVLSALDVPATTIVEDFALTSRYSDGLFAELRANAAAQGFDMAVYEPLLASNPELMEGLLDYLNTAPYQGVQGYLANAGVTSAQLETLRRLLLVEP